MARKLIRDLSDNIGKDVNVKGTVERIRKLGSIAFVHLRDRSGLVQILVDDADKISDLKKYDIISANGTINKSDEARAGYELLLKDKDIISSPKEIYPVSVSPKSNEKIDRILNNRPISLRNQKILDIFKVQATLVQAFREYLSEQEFTEIFSPKIVAGGAEGGANVFKLDYFGKVAYLAQSPQLYKQIMVGTGLERVFEVGHAYRAEQHNTNRHLNEYLSLDMEMGFIESFHDILDVEEALMNYFVNKVEDKHGDILEKYGVDLPVVNKIPRIPLDEMKDILASKYNKRFDKDVDIDPEGERLAAKYAKDAYGSDFIFLTKYPSNARPFYSMPSKEEGLTETFDLLMNGLEITSGGQRIHNYDQLVESMHMNNMNPDNFEGYLMAFKYGMPPHGGIGIGAERLTARFLNLDSAREASLFPRDRKRFSP